jgi:hypothetical protein
MESHLPDGTKGFLFYTMARPQKNNVEYFPHYISDGKKMFYIEQKYGNDGYASWFKLLETLAKTDNHWINLNEETELMFLASKCRISEQTLIYLLDDLSKLDQINSEMWAVKIVWSDKFIDSISDAYAKRSNQCLSIEGLRLHLRGLRILKGDVKPQSIVKDIIVNESIVDKHVFSFKKSLIDLGVEEPHLSDWMKVRKEKKASNTQTALTTFLNQVNESNLTADECVKICAGQSWSGFKNEWLTNQSNNYGKQTSESGRKLIEQLANSDLWKGA